MGRPALCIASVAREGGDEGGAQKLKTVALVIGAVILGACAAPAASGGTLSVTLHDNTITPSVPSVSAGPVTFSVKNVGKASTSSWC